VSFSSQFKSKVVNILTRISSGLRITLNIDGTPIPSKSHTHPSHSQTSRLLTSSLSFQSLPQPSVSETCRSLRCSFYITPILLYRSSLLSLSFPLNNKNQFQITWTTSSLRPTSKQKNCISTRIVRGSRHRKPIVVSSEMGISRGVERGVPGH
jgi:hypothetical protein